MKHQSQKALRRAEWDRRRAEKPALVPVSTYSPRAVSSSSSCDTEPVCHKNKTAHKQEEETLMGVLLADFARGAIEPEPVKLPNVPEHAPAAVMKVVADLELLFGLRLAVGDDRPMLYSVRWRQEALGLSYRTVHRVLETLVRLGAVTKGEAMPLTRTQTFRLPSDDAPGAALKACTVTIEAEDVPTGRAVEPAVEPVDEPAVGDAVGGSPAGVLNRVGAVEGGATDNVVSEEVHDDEAYEPAEMPPPPWKPIVERAIEKATTPKTRNATGFWLACQLRDNDVRPQVAWELMVLYVTSVPKGDHPYGFEEAAASYRQAYGRPPRMPSARIDSRQGSVHAQGT